MSPPVRSCYAAGALFGGLALALIVTTGGILGCSASSGPGMLSNDGGVVTDGPGGSLGGLGGSAGGVDASVDAGHLGTGGSAAGAGGATGAGGASGCVVSLDAVAPSTFTGPNEAGEGAIFSARSSVTGASSSPPVWVWTVRFGTGTIAATHVDNAAGSNVKFPIANPGNYLVTAEIAGEIACHASRVAMAIPPQPPTFVLRVTADGFPVQEKRITLVDPQPLSFILDPGVRASIFPQQVGGLTALASYVRVTSPHTDFSVEGDTIVRPLSAWLLPDVTYDVLIIPLDSTAPALISGTEADWRQGLVLDAGVPVSARTVKFDGSAVAGARMFLRNGARPSTVGTSDAFGAMQLSTRGGTLTAFILPPPASGLPQATVGAGGDPGIVLDSNTSALGLQMTWDQIVTSTLSLDVRGVDGGTHVAAARVRVRSQGAAVPVGSLLVHTAGGNPTSLTATGSIDVEVTTDTAGVATFSPLPTGSYDLTIVPPAGAGPSVAITHTTVTLVPGSPTQSVTLVRKVPLAGVILPLPASAGARITAIDSSEVAAGNVVSGIVAADGSYTLSVDPNRSYKMVVEPVVDAGLARAVLGTIVTESAGTTLTARTLPPGQPYAGRIVSGVSPVAGALIQVFCPSTSLRCLDPTFPLATTITRGDGTFDLLLPSDI